MFTIIDFLWQRYSVKLQGMRYLKNTIGKWKTQFTYLYMFVTGSVFGIWCGTKLDKAIFKKTHRNSPVVLCKRTE